MESRAPLQRSPSDPSQNRPLSALPREASESLPGRLSGIALLTRTAAAQTASLVGVVTGSLCWKDSSCRQGGEW